VTRQETKGPVTLTLSVTPETLDPSQSAYISIEVLAERGVTIHKRDYRQALLEGDRQFACRIVDSGSEKATPTHDGRLRWRSEFEIEFFLPGEYELPEAEVSFLDVRAISSQADPTDDTAGIEEQTLTTEPISIVVSGPLTGQLSEADLRQITRLDPVELPRDWGVWIWLGPLTVIVAVLPVIWVAMSLRRRRAEPAACIPAHIWAEQQFAALLAEDLPGGGRVREFYYRVSDVVRGYIQRRFTVCAPEMTTEECLVTTADDTRLGASEVSELDRFLHACDAVKYARHEPGHGESDTLVLVARDFVERTREDLAPTIRHVADQAQTGDKTA
jgi:hypothetical protein